MEDGRNANSQRVWYGGAQTDPVIAAQPVNFYAANGRCGDREAGRDDGNQAIELADADAVRGVRADHNQHAAAQNRGCGRRVARFQTLALQRGAVHRESLGIGWARPLLK